MSMQYRADEFAPIELKGDEADPAEALVTKALDDLRGTLDERLAEIEKKSSGRLDKIEAKLARPAVHTGNVDEVELETKAFSNYVAGRPMHADEQKTLTFEAPGTGGATVPPQYLSTIVAKVLEENPIRGLASTFQADSGTVEMPRLVSDATVADVSEIETRPESDIALESVDIKVHEMSVVVPISQTMYEDNKSGLDAFITERIGQLIGQREAYWFTIGAGTKQAEGVMTSAEVTSNTTAGAALTSDDLLDLQYAVRSTYANRGAWLMRRSTELLIRKLKDERGDYIWQPGLRDGAPSMILGRPVYNSDHMPAAAAGAYPILFGDFSQYLIADRVGLSILRDTVTGADNGIVRYRARRRTGGRVVVGEAFKKLRIKAA